MNPNKDQNDEHDPEEELREHSFDGIQEYDKKLPNWWLMTFYGTILFSIGYWFYFHIAEVGQTPEERLAQAQARAAAFAAEQEGEGFSEERLLAMSREDAVLDRARNAYVSNCAACHGQDGGGGAVGPSLKGEEWIHGGSPYEILQSIREGIPARGMPGWESGLGRTATAEITAFVLSLNPERYHESSSSSGSENEVSGNGDS